MCGGGGKPTEATVDPAAERQKAADEAAAKANSTMVNDKRRKRGQVGLLSSDQAEGTMLQRVANPRTTAQNVLQSVKSSIT